MHTYHAFFKGKEIELEAPPDFLCRPEGRRGAVQGPQTVGSHGGSGRPRGGAPVVHNSAILPGA